MGWREGLLRALYGIASDRPEPGTINAHQARRTIMYTKATRQLELEAIAMLLDNESESADDLRNEILNALETWRADSE